MMNLSVANVVFMGIGSILIYAGIKDISPIELVKDALEGKVTNPGSWSPETIDPPPSGAGGGRKFADYPNPDGSRFLPPGTLDNPTTVPKTGSGAGGGRKFYRQPTKPLDTYQNPFGHG